MKKFIRDLRKFKKKKIFKGRCVIPKYEFECKKCHIVYEDLVTWDETGKYKGVQCPSCASKRKTKLMSTCGFQFANPEGTDRWNSESNGHDYRFNHNLPKVLDERRRAEESSHMGPNVYAPQNDLEVDRNWGEVK